jgi:hypothetical protein
MIIILIEEKEKEERKNYFLFRCKTITTRNDVKIVIIGIKMLTADVAI